MRITQGTFSYLPDLTDEEITSQLDYALGHGWALSVEFTDEVANYCQQVLTVVPRALGPRVGKQVQQVIRAVKSGQWELVDGAPVAAGVTLGEGEYELRLVAADAEHSAPLPGGEGVVVLDTTVTPGAAQAARPASSRSVHERTVPVSVTAPPSAVTATFLASTSALRLSAASMAAATSAGFTRGWTVTAFVTPLTPSRNRTASSVARRW